MEVAEVRACKPSYHVPPALPFEFCQEGEAGHDAGAGAEGIENATPTENP